MPTPAQPPRAQGAGLRGQQRLQAIVRASREVFAEKGYEHATTAEIAQRLGISEATVFTYFSGKRALCLRVISDWYDEIIAEVERGMPLEQPIRAQLDFFVRTHLRLFLVHGTGLCALVLSEGRSKGPGLGQELAPLQRRYTAPLMDLLARGQAAGEIRSDVPLRLLRHMVLGPMEHILWEAVAQPRPLSGPAIDTAADDLMRALWPALAAGDGELASLRRLRDQVGAALRSG